MAVESMSMPVFWVSCDECKTSGQVEEAFLCDTAAVEWVMEFGWTTDGFRHHCPDCPPILEICS